MLQEFGFIDVAPPIYKKYCRMSTAKTNSSHAEGHPTRVILMPAGRVQMDPCTSSSGARNYCRTFSRFLELLYCKLKKRAAQPRLQVVAAHAGALTPYLNTPE